MINSIQKNCVTPNYGKQQVGFGAVNLKGYSLEKLQKAFQEDLNVICPKSLKNEADAKSMAARLHKGLKPVIEKFENCRETLILAITKPAEEKVNWIFASVRGSHGQSTGLGDMSPVLKAEFDFLGKVKNY